MTVTSDSKNNFYKSSIANLLAEDRLFVTDTFMNIANLASFYFGFTTGALPIGVAFELENRSDLTVLESYEGGTFSGGTNLILENLNRELDVSLF